MVKRKVGPQPAPAMKPPWNPSLTTIGIFLAVLVIVQRSATWTSSTRFNPDEAIYEASATYLHATAQPTVALNHNMVFVTAVYRGLAAWFGPYQMLPVRLLVTVMAWVMAMIVGQAVARQHGGSWGLMAGIVFLGLTHHAEGVACNREWFSMFWITLALATAERMTRLMQLDPMPTGAIWRWGIVSGMLMTGGWWFKDQSLPFLGLVPLTLLLLAIGQVVKKAELLHGLLSHVAGLIVGMIGYCIPFAMHGLLTSHVRFFVGWIDRYAWQSSLHSLQAKPSATVYLDRLLLGLHDRPTLLSAYIFGGCVLAILFMKRSATPKEEEIGAPAVLWVAALLMGLAAVCAGHRFFRHYYLYVCPSWAVLATSGCAWLLRQEAHRRWTTVLGIIAIILGIAEQVRDALKPNPTFDPVIIIFFVALLPIVGSILSRQLNDAGTKSSTSMSARTFAINVAVVALLLAQGLIGIWASRGINESIDEYDRAKSIGAALRQRANGPDDGLLVWGFYPELYSYSRLTAKTRFAFCAQLLNDIQPDVERCGLVPELGEQLFADLAAHPPRFVADAARISYFATDRKIYDLVQTPSFHAWLQARYRKVETLHDCDIYDRIEDHAASMPLPVE